MSGGLWGPCADVCLAACPTRRWCSRPGRLAARGTARSLHLAHMAPRPLQSARASARTREHMRGGLWGPGCQHHAGTTQSSLHALQWGLIRAVGHERCRVPCSMPHASLVQPARSPWQQEALRARCNLLTWPPGRCMSARASAHSSARRSVGHVRCRVPCSMPHLRVAGAAGQVGWQQKALRARCILLTWLPGRCRARARARAPGTHCQGGLWGTCAARVPCSMPHASLVQQVAWPRALRLAAAHMAPRPLQSARASCALRNTCRRSVGPWLPVCGHNTVLWPQWGLIRAVSLPALQGAMQHAPHSMPHTLLVQHRLAAGATARSASAHMAPRPLQSARASARTRHTCGEVCGARALQGAMQHAPRVAGAAGQVAWQQEALRARCIVLTWRLPAGAERAREPALHQANMRGGLWGTCAAGCHAACPTRRRSSRPGRLAAKGTARSLHLAHVAPRPLQSARASAHSRETCAEVCGARALAGCHAACPTRRRSSRPGRLAARGTARSLHRAHMASRPVQSARASACTRQTCQEVCGARALTCAMHHAPRVAGAAGQVAWQQEALRARCILLTWPPGRCRARARARAPGKHVRRSVGPVR